MSRTLLRDDQWERIAPLLAGKPGDCGVTSQHNRLFIEVDLSYWSTLARFARRPW